MRPCSTRITCSRNESATRLIRRPAAPDGAGLAPQLTFADTRRPDFITPRLIAGHPEPARSTNRRWPRVGRQEPPARPGVPIEFAVYVLPNAKAVRLIESGPLIALIHKWTQRTCFNAQEEIYDASMDELQQVASVIPD